VEELIELGADRVIVGSVAARDPALLGDWIAEFGARRVAVAVDLRGGQVAVDGWTSTLEDDPMAIVARVVDRGAEVVVCTDIGRDGMLQGANVDLYRRVRARFPELELIASGGVSCADDLDLLRSVGVSGAIVGTAWYEGHITMRQMVERSSSARLTSG
jgi:phosphoribosylformimino-5-aminoimidazole carboxamide ribotide isomerase